MHTGHPGGAALITTEQLAAHLGRTFTDTERAQAESIIGQVTAFIEAYTGHRFTPLRLTTLARADGHGTITLWPRPVRTVRAVLHPMVDVPMGEWVFDGFGTITGLPAGITVRVDLDVGWVAVPADIHAVALGMTGRQVTNPVGIRQETVGGISLTYASAFGEAGAIAMSTTERDVLDDYRGRHTSWRLGT